MNRRLILTVILVLLLVASAFIAGRKAGSSTGEPTATPQGAGASVRTVRGELGDEPQEQSAGDDAAASSEDASANGDCGEDCVDDATIVLYDRVAAAKVGIKPAAVIAELGPADKVENQVTDLGKQRTYTWGLNGSGLQVVARGGSIVQVSTTNEGDRTSKDIGPGSTSAKLQAAYPGLSCDGAAGTTVCRLVKGTGGLVTDFFVDNASGKVTRVVIGAVD